MGKGRSDKPAVEKYLEQVEWENQRRSSPKGYYGKWFDLARWGAIHTKPTPVSVRIIGLVGILIIAYLLFSIYKEGALLLVILLLSPVIIIFFAARDGKKKK
ncbi:MAG: hypothetical protein HN855_03790 [Anaerolineae bacterium]|jgi:hypothetical protein|nr:hypothetical protein [Anaerolineae bacterium]MBT7324255.1 hypothetical protein [Anaerolineae bacterium]